jgi:hypothetical protein
MHNLDLSIAIEAGGRPNIFFGALRESSKIAAKPFEGQIAIFLMFLTMNGPTLSSSALSDAVIV